MRHKTRKYYKFALPALGVGIGLGLLTITAPSIITVSGNQKSINIDSDRWNVMDDSVIGQQIGTVRHWNNTGFSGAEIKDGGFIALTGQDGISRTDSFGNVLWKFSPSDKTIKGYDESWENKKAVEIVQDKASGYSNVFYVLLVPNQAPEESSNTPDGKQLYKYSEILQDPAKQATVVQIIEDVSGSVDGSLWSPAFAIGQSVNINPEFMVDNYPKTWKNPQNSSDGISFFSVTQHASWYDNDSGSDGFVMPWRQYITNLGNMYGYQGTLFMFGGNGTIFNDPEALSIGLWRIRFNTVTPEVTGLPYAYAFSGISWFIDVQPSVDGSTGVYHSPKKPIEYDSKLPLGQDVTFSYVPRMAVAGVQPNFYGDKNNNENLVPNYLYIAGSITTGQSKDSQSVNKPNKGMWWGQETITDIISTKHDYLRRNDRADGWNATWNKTSTRSLQPSGENEIASQPLSGKATTENSIDPLTLFGTPLSLAALMSFDAKTTNNPYGYTNVMANPRYYDTPVFAGAQSGNYTNLGKKQPIYLSGESSNGALDDVNMRVKIQVDIINESVRFFLSNTIIFGHSPKNVSGLIQFTDKDGNEGYMYQVGVATVSFVAPQFSTSSLVYRNPAKSTLPFESIGEGHMGDKSGYNNPLGGYTTEFWFTGPANNDGKTRLITFETMINPLRTAIFDNWKMEDITACWKYSDLSKQLHKSTRSTRDIVVDEPKNTTAKRTPQLDFKSFRGLSSSLDATTNTNNLVQSAWESKTTSKNGETTKGSNIQLAVNPLLTTFSEEMKKVGAQNSNTNFNASIVLAYKAYAPKRAWNGKIFSTLAYYPTNFYSVTFKDGVETFESGSDESISTLFDPEANSPHYSFVGQLEGNEDITKMEYDSKDKNLELSTKNGQQERMNTLGSGTFKTRLSNELLQKNIFDLFDFNVDVPGLGGNLVTLNQKWLPEFFTIQQEPKWDKVDPDANIDKVKLIVSNMNLVNQTMTLTAYSYNQESGKYALMPSSNGTGISSISVANFIGFKALASWVLPVVISVPTIILLLSSGLAIGIGYPRQKKKEMERLGIDNNKKKVHYYKKIINSNVVLCTTRELVDDSFKPVSGIYKREHNKVRYENLKKSLHMYRSATKELEINNSNSKNKK